MGLIKLFENFRQHFTEQMDAETIQVLSDRILEILDSQDFLTKGAEDSIKDSEGNLAGIKAQFILPNKKNISIQLLSEFAKAYLEVVFNTMDVTLDKITKQPRKTGNIYSVKTTKVQDPKQFMAQFGEKLQQFRKEISSLQEEKKKKDKYYEPALQYDQPGMEDESGIDESQLKTVIARVLQELEPYQKRVQASHSKKKSDLIAQGGNKDSGPHKGKPELKRSKSAPPGFGGS